MRGTALDEAAICRYLETARVGRVATHDHESGSSELTPLLFVHRRGRIYLATQPGRKLTLLRRYPQGVGLQCDEAVGPGWISVFAWGRYRDVPPGREYGRAMALMAAKYRAAFVDQLSTQARRAVEGGIRGVWRAVSGASLGCIDLERMGGRVWGLDDENP